VDGVVGGGCFNALDLLAWTMPTACTRGSEADPSALALGCEERPDHLSWKADADVDSNTQMGTTTTTTTSSSDILFASSTCVPIYQFVIYTTVLP
jgi:hypothetical protein